MTERTASSFLAPTGLLVGAVGLAIATAFNVRPGLVILLVGVLVSTCMRGRAAAVVALGAALLVCYNTVGPDLVAQVTGRRGAMAAVGRWIEFAGLAVAVGSAGFTLWRAREPGSRGWAQVTGLVMLCAVGAELLTAYSDSTGNPGAVAFAVVFFAALYGAPALLAREVVRRRGWGWPSMLLIFMALGVAQACLIDQSMFSIDYQGYEGWDRMRELTFLPVLGTSANNLFGFVLGHAIYSFAAPVALAEGWRPDRAHEPWLGPVGLVIASVAYAGSAVLIVVDPASHSGNAWQLVVSAIVVITLAAGAAVLGCRRSSAHGPDRQLPVWVVLVVAFPLALSGNLGDATWTGVALNVSTTVVAGVLLLVASRQTQWTYRHVAAVGLAFLVARGALAFTYYPLLGDVTPAAKYTHNIVMLAVVLVAGGLALAGPGSAVRFRGDPAQRP